MSPSSAELRRLMHLLLDTANKAEQEAYEAGWRDCHAAMLKAVAMVADRPAVAAVHDQRGAQTSAHAEPVPHVEASSGHSPAHHTNGAVVESSFTN